MKKITNILFLTLLSLFIISCEKNDENNILDSLKSNNGLTFNENQKKWNELKVKNGNSYTYTIKRSSIFGGFIQTTTLVIQNDIVIARHFESYTVDLDSDDFNLILMDTYDENETNLGENTQGAELKTIEDYYNDCSSEYLIVNESNNTITFSTSDSGIITKCGYTDNRCADDCYRGYWISDFEWNKQ